MQVMFERGVEFADGEHHEPDEDPPASSGSAQPVGAAGCAEWPGVVERLDAPVLPHMGWNTVEVPQGSRLFAGLDADTRFYFVHSYGVRSWLLEPSTVLAPPLVTWCGYGGGFVAAVENGALSATQFHPEKSGDAGAQLLENWVGTL